MEKAVVVKIGGNVIDDETKLSLFLKGFAAIEGFKILVHGGGKAATRLGEQLGIPQQMIEGRRITNAETLKIVTMVYAGYINKNMVAQLQAHKCNAIGLCGADANVIQARKRVHATIDYGYAGDVTTVNTTFIQALLNQQLTPVLSPITHNREGGLLNTNADTIAQEIAKALSSLYSVYLVYCFEKKGVLSDVTDNDSVIKIINPDSYKKLKKSGTIFEGMIPKLDNAFEALQRGVAKVMIGQADNIQQLVTSNSGTTITNE